MLNAGRTGHMAVAEMEYEKQSGIAAQFFTARGIWRDRHFSDQFLFTGQGACGKHRDQSLKLRGVRASGLSGSGAAVWNQSVFYFVTVHK